MSHTRRVIAVFCTALVVGCNVLVASSPAALAATCSGTGCDASDPYSTGCAGSGASYYVAETTPLIKESTGVASNSYGYIQLWWSNTCDTNWTRMVVNVSGAASGLEEVFLDRNNSAGSHYCISLSSGSNGAYISCQIYAAGIPAASYGDLESSNGTILYHAYVAQPGY
jgi:hypothetical protein